MSNDLPWFPSGATAARMSSPGAMKSGFMMSSPPIPARPGPRDENAATNGAGWLVTTVPFEIVTGAFGFAARNVRIVFPTVWLTWIDGTKCRSAFTEFALVFAMIIPRPPFWDTSRLLSIRALTPRSQNTILPATFAGSSVPRKQRRTSSAFAPGRPAEVDRIPGPVVA